MIDIPNLIDIHQQFYSSFLQLDVPSDEREDVGLQGVFKSVFPIKDFNETCSLDFVSYHLERPKYDVQECHQRGMTYAAPLKVVIRLVVWDKGEEEDAIPSIRDVKEQEVYFGEIPSKPMKGHSSLMGLSGLLYHSFTDHLARSSTTTRERRTRPASCSTARA